MRNLAKRLGFLGQKMAGAAFEEPIVFRYARVTGTLVVLGSRQQMHAKQLSPALSAAETPLTPRFAATWKVDGLRLLIPRPPIAESRYQHGTAQDTSDRNFVPKRDLSVNVTKHAIARATEQQYAMRCAGRFGTTARSVVVLSTRVAAEGRLEP